MVPKQPRCRRGDLYGRGVSKSAWCDDLENDLKHSTSLMAGFLATIFWKNFHALTGTGGNGSVKDWRTNLYYQRAWVAHPKLHCSWYHAFAAHIYSKQV